MKSIKFVILASLISTNLVQASECPSDLVRVLNIGTASKTLGMGITIRDADLQLAKAAWDQRIAQRKKELTDKAIEYRVQSYQAAFDERERVIEERAKDLQTVDSLLEMIDQIYDLANKHISFRRSGIYKALSLVGLAKSQAQINDELIGVFGVINDRVEESMTSVGRGRTEGGHLIGALDEILGKDVMSLIDENLLHAELGVLEGTALSMAEVKMSLLELKAGLTAEVADLKLRGVAIYKGLCTLKADQPVCSDLDLQKRLGLISIQERDALVAERERKAAEEAALKEAKRQESIRRARAEEEERRKHYRYDGRR